MNNFRILCVSILLFVLCYHLNPLNSIMQDSLAGPVSFLVDIWPELVVLVGKFILLMIVIGLPCVLLGPLRNSRGFLAPGLLCGIVSAIVSVLKFIVFEKGDFEASIWFAIAPTFAFVYFLLGFATGGLWGYLGNKTLWKATGESG